MWTDQHCRQQTWGNNCPNQTQSKGILEIQTVPKTFLKQDRRDARELQANNWNYDEQQCTLARKTYSQVKEGKKIMTRGGCSIAYYGIRKSEPYTQCPLCKAKIVPCWNHSLWHCAYFQNRPAIPISHAAQRLGWPDDDETPKSHLTRVSWMAHVKQAIHARCGFHDTTSSENPHDHA